MMRRIFMLGLSLMMFVACAKVEMNGWHKYDLPEGFRDSHILSIDTKNDGMLIGTFGRGALLRRGDGASWTVFDTSNGLSWNFITGGDWDGNYIILSTLGDGLNISFDNGENWKRYGYNFFGIEYLYAVGAKINNGRKFIPTADGLVVFDSISDWRAVAEAEGISSQYIYDMKIDSDVIALGTLHGFVISHDAGSNWLSFSPNGKYTSEQLPASKVRAIEFHGENLHAGCDDGLYLSTDLGKTWTHLGREYLSSRYIRDLVFDEDDNLWIATYEEIASYNQNSKAWRVFNIENGLPSGGVNCLGVTSKGKILAGTNYGLFTLVEAVPAPLEIERVDETFSATEEPLHQWMLRPVRPDDQNCKDQTYLYGSTMGGNFRQHQGNEYNAPEGTPLLAVDDGIIVYIDREIGHSVLRCEYRQDDFYVYAHYHHQHQIYKRVGDRVGRGEIVGSIGKKGNVTNEHLHFEVSLSTVDDSNKDSHTRNPELWVEPLPGTGTIVGQLVGSDDEAVAGARIYGLTKPIPTESPFSFAETYQDKVNPDESYNENFVIGDVPEGDYVLYANEGENSIGVRVHVETGMITVVKMKLK